MSFDAARMMELLPAIYRLRDAAERSAPGERGALEALIAVLAEQTAVLEEDLAQLYDDQFIETCADWVVPYLGDLIGYRGLHGGVPRLGSPRAEVANTIGYRRRKGTAAMLEELARDVTGWNARVVEFFLLLATTQFLNHIRRENLATVDLRQGAALQFLGTPFETQTRTVDVRSVAKRRGKYNIPNVGIFLWRLGAYGLTDSPAVAAVGGGIGSRWYFNPLGCTMPLYNTPASRDRISLSAQPVNAPIPIPRREMKENLSSYYGKDRSVFLTVDGVEQTDLKLLSVCDLSDLSSGDWAHTEPTKIAIDPVLGRIAFPAGQNPSRVVVRCYYGFSADMGGGEYERETTFDADTAKMKTVIPVAGGDMTALQTSVNSLPARGGVIEIEDSGRYVGTLTIDAGTRRIEIRAKNGCFPTLVLASELKIKGDQAGKDNGTVILNGLRLSGARLRVTGMLRYLFLRHCTLVPGLSLDPDGSPAQPGKPSLVVDTDDANTLCEIEIDHCITGALRMDAVRVELRVQDSIVDSPARSGTAFPALAADDAGTQAGAKTTLERTTVFGAVHVASLPLASECIFTDAVISQRRQEGCVRFSYVPDGSQTPRRYQCLPKSADDSESADEPTQVFLEFTSQHYGDAAYGQLGERCSDEIKQGAEDEAEMGAFHDLFQPQRETNLRVRLEEYLRFGLEAGIFYES
jgi:hypothetical protein